VGTSVGLSICFKLHGLSRSAAVLKGFLLGGEVIDVIVVLTPRHLLLLERLTRRLITVRILDYRPDPGVAVPAGLPPCQSTGAKELMRGS
jgi:hypothetical protein